jgi:golgi-specific brefeldin A-resistance guanine nucleotide exchange factor 1
LKADWLTYGVDSGLIDTLPENSRIDFHDKIKNSRLEISCSPKSVAYFLRYTPGLGKSQVGEYIGKGPADLYPFHAAVLKEYVETFDFSGDYCAFDKALRLFLGHFRLPGEAQCIDRIMEAFAGKLYQALGNGKPFSSADGAFILAFSTIMLNTDLHNPQIPVNKKMTM